MDSELSNEYLNLYWKFNFHSGQTHTILTQQGKFQAIRALAERGILEKKDYLIEEVNISSKLLEEFGNV